MKKHILGLVTVLVTTIACAQPDWNTVGNTGTKQTTDFVGTTDAQDLRFRTFGQFRMGLNGTTGFPGLNTTSPVAGFHLWNGYRC